MTATKQKSPPARKGSPARKGAARANGNGSANGTSLNEIRAAEGLPPSPPEEFVPTTAPAAPANAPAASESPKHPYGDVKLFVFQPRDGSEPIVFPHISTCRPDPLFLYDNRHKDELRQCFAWMDRAGVPDDIGRRVWMLPEDEQAAVVSGWFAGLELRKPQGVSPPGES